MVGLLQNLYPQAYGGVPIVQQSVDGPTLVAAAAASCIAPAARLALPANYFVVGKAWKVRAQGKISCVVTTPGTARFDFRLGAAGNSVVFDTGAMALNVVAKVNVPWWFEAMLICRAIGATANLFGSGMFMSEAVVGSPLGSAGGVGALLQPNPTAVGGNFDNTVAGFADCFFTQTVATGSLTVQSYEIQESHSGAE
jgi:hypothetical protein